MLRILCSLVIFASAAHATEIKLNPKTVALLVKTHYATKNPELARLNASDFKVKFNSEAVEFTLTRQTCGMESEAGPERSIAGTAFIVIHKNGIDYRKLRLGPGLTLDSVTQLQPVVD